MKKFTLIVMMLCMASFIAEDAKACRLVSWVRSRPRIRRVVRVPVCVPVQCIRAVVAEGQTQSNEGSFEVVKEPPKIAEKPVVEIVDVPVMEKTAEPKPPEKIEIPEKIEAPERGLQFKLLPDDVGLASPQ